MFSHESLLCDRSTCQCSLDVAPLGGSGAVSDSAWQLRLRGLVRVVLLSCILVCLMMCTFFRDVLGFSNQHFNVPASAFSQSCFPLFVWAGQSELWSGFRAEAQAGQSFGSVMFLVPVLLRLLIP